MSKKRIDLSDIKEFDLDKTSSFTDLMSRSERRNRLRQKELNGEIEFTETNNKDIEEMIDERKKSTKDLTIQLEKAKQEYKSIEKNEDDELSKTQILELTRQMKFNLKDNIKEERKKGYNYITFIGIFILIALAYFIYSLLFTNYLDNEIFLLINCGIILLMFLLFGITLLTTKRNNKFLAILNFLILLGYIAFNVLYFFNILDFLKYILYLFFCFIKKRKIIFSLLYFYL